MDKHALFLSCLIYFVCGVTCAENDIGYFWHVTDFHYDHTYNDKLSCNGDVPGQLPDYGDYWCDATWKLVVDSIKAMAAIKPDVDFLLWTGDSVAHIVDNKLSLELNLQVVKNITDSINATFNKVPVYATLGNHDFFPNGQANPNQSDPFYSNITDMWQDWIISQANAISDSKQGGFYAVKIGPKIRMLALNTNLYYTSDKLTPNVSDPVGQFAWMKTQLEDAKSKGEKVIVAGHVPPGLFIPEYSDWYWPVFKVKFMDIILNYTDIIVALHFGHDHYDGFKLLKSDDDSKAVPQFNAPSVTPWRYKIMVNGVQKIGDPHNPGLRLIKYNKTSGVQLDYSQYFINITTVKTVDDWKILYNFTSTYGVSDMGVDSLRDLFKKLEDNNSPLYQKFCNNWVVSDTDKRCTNAMRVDIFCGGQYYRLDKATQCSADRLKQMNGVSGLSGKSSMSLALLILALVKRFS